MKTLVPSWMTNWSGEAVSGDFFTATELPMTMAPQWFSSCCCCCQAKSVLSRKKTPSEMAAYRPAERRTRLRVVRKTARATIRSTSERMPQTAHASTGMKLTSAR